MADVVDISERRRQIVLKEIEALIPRLRRFAGNLSHNNAAADDLVQATLERALTRLHLFDGSHLLSWLFKMMNNLRIDLARTHQERFTVELDDMEYARHKADGHQEIALTMRDLGRAIAKLPPEQRVIVLLQSIEGMSLDEIAVILDIPLGTVQSRSYRARDTLRLLVYGEQRRHQRRGVGHKKAAR